MIQHDLRNVRLAFDGKTLLCDEHGPLAGMEADAVWNRFRLAMGGEGEPDLLERSARLQRWPLRWLVAAVQGVSRMINPPHCKVA